MTDTSKADTTYVFGDLHSGYAPAPYVSELLQSVRAERDRLLAEKAELIRIIVESGVAVRTCSIDGHTTKQSIDEYLASIAKARGDQ